jgi:hypothetical protein
MALSTRTWTTHAGTDMRLSSLSVLSRATEAKPVSVSNDSIRLIHPTNASRADSSHRLSICYFCKIPGKPFRHARHSARHGRFDRHRRPRGDFCRAGSAHGMVDAKIAASFTPPIYLKPGAGQPWRFPRGSPAGAVLGGDGIRIGLDPGGSALHPGAAEDLSATLVPGCSLEGRTRPTSANRSLVLAGQHRHPRPYPGRAR